MQSVKIIILSALAVSTLAAPTANGAIPNQYILRLKAPSANEKFTLDSHLDFVNKIFAKNIAITKSSIVEKVIHKYDNLGEFSGYAIKATEASLAEIEASGHVNVYPDTKKSIIGAFDSGISASMPWGIDRIDAHSGTDSIYAPQGNGSGVTVYVIDTGITASHPEFEGRASEGAYFSETSAKDGHGHGTHCAGTVGSKSYGVAKGARIVGVKVLNKSGSGEDSGVIAGINWVAGQAVAGKTVASMSLGGGKSIPLDDAVNAAVAKGIPFSVAAGNSGKDACILSPSGAADVFTVAASDKRDTLASFSERGKCIEIIAPGVSILSTWLNGGTNTISGTSMACPHVAGAFALLLSTGSYVNATSAYSALLARADTGKISSVPSNTPNKFLYVGA